MYRLSGTSQPPESRTGHSAPQQNQPRKDTPSPIKASKYQLLWEGTQAHLSFFPQGCLSGEEASQSGGSKPLPTPSPVQQFQEAGQQRLWHRVTQGFLLTLLGRLFCSRSCPRTSGCLSVKPGHRGCPCWQQGPAYLAARSHPTPCRIRLVGCIFHPVTGLWQGQEAPRQGSQCWSVPAWQPQAGPGCGCEPRVPGTGDLKRRWRHGQRVIVKVEMCVQQAVGLCPHPPRHSGLPT